MENVELKSLKRMILSFNKIKDINILGDININKICYLELSHNNISNIEVFKEIPLKYLNTLNISYNCIQNIRPLENLYIPRIKYIFLENNLYVRCLQKNVDIINNLSRLNNHHFLYVIQ